jgi:hypothetical protein
MDASQSTKMVSVAQYNTYVVRRQHLFFILMGPSKMCLLKNILQRMVQPYLVCLEESPALYLPQRNPQLREPKPLDASKMAITLQMEPPLTVKIHVSIATA